MKEGFDITDIGVIAGFLAAVLGDFAFVFCIGVLIPGIGLAFLAGILFAHYFAGILMGAFFLPKAQGWLAKLAVILAILIPLPLLTVGVVLGVLLSNKFVAFFAKQAIIQGVALATAGAGEALEGAEVAEVGAEAAATATEAAGALAEGAEGSGVAAQEMAGGAGQAGETTTEAAEGAAKSPEEMAHEEEIEKELGGETEEEPMKLLEEKTFEETPEEMGGETEEAGEEEGETERGSENHRVKQVRDIINHLDERDQPRKQQEEGGEEPEEEAA